MFLILISWKNKSFHQTLKNIFVATIEFRSILHNIIRYRDNII